MSAAAVTACGSTATPSGSSAPTTTTGAAAPTPVKPGALQINDQAAGQLCDMIRPELSNWRVQGPTLGRLGYNIMVQDWAARNGGINLAVLADKPVIDRITTKSCSDVRSQAIDALQLTDLASGLAF
ncbi:hypothetical protein D5S18_30700 [Nocardia panacis]|uniref:Uncharacterized protein n=2 Tax=Nocardia panacis TaxID=2340916 RepID=A0A3A4KAY9_9NOCA|nr:hypothetical protein D5S18_30700 [Nocardia panacis]